MMAWSLISLSLTGDRPHRMPQYCCTDTQMKFKAFEGDTEDEKMLNIK